ncbi:MAG: lytic transglycosylase domain-containing protein [Methylococcaceae bacterium]
MRLKNKAGISILVGAISISVAAGPQHQFTDAINKAAIEHRLPVALIIEVMRQESSFNPEALSKAGAKGLMQLMDETAEKYSVTDSFNPEQNINAGAKYLRGLIDRYNSVRLALAAYNAGEKAVDRYKGIPPYKETRDYLKRVSKGYLNRTGREL